MLSRKLIDLNSKLLLSNRLSNLEYEKIEEYKRYCTSFIQNMTDYMEENIKDGTSGKLKVKVNFIDDINPKCSTSILNDSVYRARIDINMGLLIHLYELFNEVDYETFISDGKNKKNIIEMLYNTSLRLVLYHEIAHIYFGHLYYKHSYENKESNKYILDLRTLEWDADSYAITQIIFSANDSRITMKDDATSKLMNQICIYAIHCVFFLFRKRDEFNNKEHIASVYRYITMLNVIRDKSPYNHDFIEYFKYIENGLNKFYEEPMDEVSNFYNSIASNSSQLEEVEKNWQVLKFKLKEYSLLPIHGVDY